MLPQRAWPPGWDGEQRCWALSHSLAAAAAAGSGWDTCKARLEETETPRAGKGAGDVGVAAYHTCDLPGNSNHGCGAEYLAGQQRLVLHGRSGRSSPFPEGLLNEEK